MPPETDLEFSDYALRRMAKRLITEAHVWYCIVHHDENVEYCPANGEVVWRTVLPDGRNIKVRVREGSSNPMHVIDAFSFQ